MGLINAKKLLPFRLVVVLGPGFGAQPWRPLVPTRGLRPRQGGPEIDGRPEVEALEIDGQHVASIVDELGRTW